MSDDYGVIRVAQRGRFLVIDRRTVRDSKLSFRARGALAWILDQQDGVPITRAALRAAAPEGLDAMRKVLKELVDNGYLVRNYTRNSDGRVTCVSTIYEVPPHKVVDQPPEPEVGNQPPVNQPPVFQPHRERVAEGVINPLAESNDSPKKSPPKPVSKPRRRNPVWDALVEVTGVTPTTSTARTNLGKNVRELKEVGATPEEIRKRAKRYHQKYSELELTGNALVKHWDALAGGVPSSNGRRQEQWW